MAVRLVALDEGPDISLDREMLVVGRHPQCDARLDSIRVSRRHCCMTPDNGDIVVKDLGSTNGIRINGQRVEKGRLRVGDELSIAHIRYRLDDGDAQEATVAEPIGERNGYHARAHDDARAGFRLRAASSTPFGGQEVDLSPPPSDDNPLAAAVRHMLPAGMAEKCQIQVIVRMPNEADSGEGGDASPPDLSP